MLVLFGTTPAARPRSFLMPRDLWRRLLAFGTWSGSLSPESLRGNATSARTDLAVKVSVFQRYEDRWGVLLNSAYNLPILLPTRFWRLAQDPKVRLPEDHPWRTASRAAWS